VAEEKYQGPSRGHIFVCAEKTREECYRKSLFGSSKAYGAPVLRLKKGDILFLNDLSNDSLSGIYKAASDGGMDIEPEAWKGKYPYQIRFKNLQNTVVLPNAKKILRRLDYNHNTLLTGEKLALLIDLFVYRAMELEDIYIERRTGSQERVDNIASGDAPLLAATTLWNFPKQSYGATPKGDSKYPGVTPALVIYNLLWRYTKPGDSVVDPMCGSGTTIDVCREEARSVRGFDISPVRDDISKADARELPISDGVVDMVFIDSPYGDNINYNSDPANLDKMSSDNELFYDALEKVMQEAKRILKSGKILAWLISDQWENGKFIPVGFKTFERLSRHFEPIDIVSVARRGQSSHTEEWINRSRRLNFYLRGFKYLIIVKKPLTEEDKRQEPRTLLKEND